MQGLKEGVSNGDVTYQQILDEVCTSRSSSHPPLAQAAVTIHEEGGHGGWAHGEQEPALAALGRLWLMRHGLQLARCLIMS